jgi:lipoate-protein ligase A
MAGMEIMLCTDRSTHPAENLAREDRLFEGVDSGELPELIRFWTNAECLIRGRVKHRRYGWYDEELASELGVPVYQRSTGGGVVYNDEGNLNWSVFLKTDGRFLSPPVGFEKASTQLVRGLQTLGIAARFAPPNRIDVSGKKVSGMAARSTRRTLLVHGTLLINTNLKRLNELCLPPAGCPPVANLSELKHGVKRDDIISSVERYLREARISVRPAEGPGLE